MGDTELVAIGNSDDRLTQARWSEFRRKTDEVVRSVAIEVYGAWVSPSADPYQNAAWSFRMRTGPGMAEDAHGLASALRALCSEFDQEWIAWTSGHTAVIRP